MAENIGYTANELKNLLVTLLQEVEPSTPEDAEALAREARKQVEQEFAEKGDPAEGAAFKFAVIMRSAELDRLASHGAMVVAISRLIAENNEKLLADLRKSKLL